MIPLLVFFLVSVFPPFFNPQIDLIDGYTNKVNQKECTKCVKHRTCWISHSDPLLLFLCILRFPCCRTASAAASTVAAAPGASDMFPFFMVLICFINEKNTISDYQNYYYNICYHCLQHLAFSLIITESRIHFLHPAPFYSRTLPHSCFFILRCLHGTFRIYFLIFIRIWSEEHEQKEDQ